jgi:hypothetical protein
MKMNAAGELPDISGRTYRRAVLVGDVVNPSMKKTVADLGSPYKDHEYVS